MKSYLFLVFSLLSFAVQACPFCDTKTAADIRASLFGPDLLFNLFTTILPFIVFAAIAYLIYYGGFPFRKQDAFSTKPEETL